MTDNSRNFRIFVEKKPDFRIEAESLRRELNENLHLNIQKLRLFCVYDLFGFDSDLYNKCCYGVFGEAATDTVVDSREFTMPESFLATEYLPGQFDQRASSARDCVRLIAPEAEVEIRSGRLIAFAPALTEEEMERVEQYCLNPVESRRKDMDSLELPAKAVASEPGEINGFIDMTHDDAVEFCRREGLAMNADDLMMMVDYFSREGRNPNQTELRILDTYWSDHCRHTTFSTRITGVEIEDFPGNEDLKESLQLWEKMREELGRSDKPFCLMDLATIGARWLSAHGLLPDLERSEENNACSIYIDVDVDGTPERWLLQFKNETHNHPTEIEPFGGASTCLGGAIRDPLSGRAYVYQAMRVSGAADITAPMSVTLKGKLPQRVISTRAAAGYSSYGNQIGLATTHVREVFHPGYVAKRMEVGAVVGAVKADCVRRESPAPGDVIIMFGGRTGRDGIGGATGSSKQHTVASLETCGSEVQKGNAPEERKIQRLMRRPDVCRLIKKSNDFGAGGVSVAIGELADGLDIYLDRVLTKYSGLNTMELAISESQERMAVVVEAADKEKFMNLCAEENLEAVHIADVTDSGRMRMFFKSRKVVDLSRSFIDSAGAPHFAEVRIVAPKGESPLCPDTGDVNIKKKMLEVLASPNVASQKGLAEMFDASIGASTLQMPFGGTTQRTESQVSLQKIPVGSHFTNTASIMSFGFNPELSNWSPYHGAAYAYVEAVAKAAAAGALWSRLRFSFQEFFEKTSSSEAWGKPLAALLGALRMQKEFGLPAIGGKDSMSGTFDNLSVPPTLIAFAVAPMDARQALSPEFKQADDYVYLIPHNPLEGGMPDTKQLRYNYTALHALVGKGKVKAAAAVTFGGVGAELAKMTFGNRIGATVEYDASRLFMPDYGSLIIETAEPLEASEMPGALLLGRTVKDESLTVNGVRMPLSELWTANCRYVSDVYPLTSGVSGKVSVPVYGTTVAEYPGEPKEHPLVYLPSFPGTNCDYDMEKAFRREGAEVIGSVFRNLSAKDIDDSVAEMAGNIDRCDILVFSGGFSVGDEPDGSGKFIAGVIRNPRIKTAIENLLARGGLILGICNGFQALVKSGLLPFGKIGELDGDSPTLFRNDINRHISQMVTTRVATLASPWLSGFEPGELHKVAASHGEGKFMLSQALASQLADNGQIAFQYVDADGNPTMESPFNPNGSVMAIEGIISPDGRILGKMAHSERWEEGLMANIPGNKNQNIFKNAIKYFRKK